MSNKKTIEMEQVTKENTNRQISCPSCFLKLSLIQAQMENIEKMLFCIKDTLNFKEACRYTGLSHSQLYKLIKTSEIPYYKPNGKLIYFSKRELDDWLCQNHTETGQKDEAVSVYESINSLNDIIP